MTYYEFVTLWQVDAPLEKVWNAIVHSEEWPQWWSPLISATEIARGNAMGLGAIWHFVWNISRERQVCFDCRVVKVEDLRSLVVEARGELVGRGVWDLSEMESGTLVRLTWTVGLSAGGWLKKLAWGVKPLVARHHNEVMQQGAIGLGEFLGVEVSEPIGQVLGRRVAIG